MAIIRCFLFPGFIFITFMITSFLFSCCLNTKSISVKKKADGSVLTKEIGIKEITFYENEKCLKPLEDTALSVRVKDYVKTALKEKLEKQGFIVINFEEAKGKEMNQVYLEIKAWRRAKFFGLFNFLEAKTIVYSGGENKEQLEILVSSPINSTDEKIVKKIIDELIDRIVEALTEKIES